MQYTQIVQSSLKLLLFIDIQLLFFCKKNSLSKRIFSPLIQQKHAKHIVSILNTHTLSYSMTIMKKFSLLVFGLCLSGLSQAQVLPSDLEDMTKAPKTIRQFQNLAEASTEVDVRNIDSPLARLIALTPGVYDNKRQIATDADTELMEHTYIAVPVFEQRNTPHKWFYEQIQVAFDPQHPFSQRLFYYEETHEGLRRRSFVIPSDALSYANFWNDPEARKRLEKLQIEDLIPIPSCDMHLKMLSDDHFMVYHKAPSCHDPALKNVASIRYEGHYFPEGVALRPLGFNDGGDVVWGFPNEYYLFERSGSIH